MPNLMKSFHGVLALCLLMLLGCISACTSKALRDQPDPVAVLNETFHFPYVEFETFTIELSGVSKQRNYRINNKVRDIKNMIDSGYISYNARAERDIVGNINDSIYEMICTDKTYLLGNPDKEIEKVHQYTESITLMNIPVKTWEVHFRGIVDTVHYFHAPSNKTVVNVRYLIERKNHTPFAAWSDYPSRSLDTLICVMEPSAVQKGWHINTGTRKYITVAEFDKVVQQRVKNGRPSANKEENEEDLYGDPQYDYEGVQELPVDSAAMEGD